MIMKNQKVTEQRILLTLMSAEMLLNYWIKYKFDIQGV
jgi:hypothetical protein